MVKRIRDSGRLVTPLLLALLFCGSAQMAFAATDLPDNPVPTTEARCEAQGTAAKAPAPATAPPQNPQGPQDKEAKDEVPKRIFFIIPNFMTANDQPENQGPLTSGEKFNIAWHQYADYSAHFGNLLQAAISQAGNGIPHYGQGWIPFGERFLAQEGDQASGAFLIYGALPTLLREDPRYFRKGRGSAWSRVYYAATRVLITRTDSGHATFNVPSVVGQFGQAAISLSYYPPQDRSIKGLFQGWSVGQIYNIGWNQLKEFTPDLAAFIRRHHKSKGHDPASGSTD